MKNYTTLSVVKPHYYYMLGVSSAFREVSELVFDGLRMLFGVLQTGVMC
mgnify:CR=1 FL=1